MSYVTKSPWVIHYDGSSCNGCDIEVLACLTPMYDAERFGIINTGNPKHADIFLVTGGVNEQNKNVVKQIYDLAAISHEPLKAEEMTAFIARSQQILKILA